MIKMSNKIILLCDDSKIEKVSFAQFAKLDKIDTLITNTLTQQHLEKFENIGIEVITQTK